MPRRRPVARRLAVNAGSVGRPKHGNSRAVYALITLGAADATVEFVGRESEEPGGRRTSPARSAPARAPEQV